MFRSEVKEFPYLSADSKVLVDGKNGQMGQIELEAGESHTTNKNQLTPAAVFNRHLQRMFGFSVALPHRKDTIRTKVEEA
jgi:hypothetical protein